MKKKILLSNHGKILITVTWALLLFANYTTVVGIFGRWFRRNTKLKPNPFLCFTLFGCILFFFYEFLSITALICHSRAVFGNPGTTKLFAPVSPPIEIVNPRYCKLCDYRWKPSRAHHCRKCQICVLRMDHHCTWIDNCVGILNQKFFILFLIYTAILCLYQIFLLSVSFGLWLYHRPLVFCLKSFLPHLFLCIESFIFLHITSEFLCEQIEALETNSTLVESHQKSHGTPKSLSENLVDVFGQQSFLWCFPTLPKLKICLNEPVYLQVPLSLKENLKKREKISKTKIS